MPIWWLPGRRLACALLIALVHDAQAQATDPGSEYGVDCRDCTHLAQRVRRLQAGDAGVPLLQLNSKVVRDSRGRYFVGPVDEGSHIAVFSERGAFSTILGRRGSGPGEFREIDQLVLLRGDSLAVFDLELRRLSVFSPELRFVRSMALPSHRLLLAGAAKTIFGFGAVRSARQDGFALHEYARRDGRHLRSFATLRRSRSDESELGDVVSAATSAAGDVFTVQDRPLRIRRRDQAGEGGPTLAYQPPWHPHPAPPVASRPGRRASGELVAGRAVPLQPAASCCTMGIDSDTVLRLFGGVPDPTWKRGANPYLQKPERGAPPRPGDDADKLRDINGWYDGIVEIVRTDRLLTRASLVARFQIPGALGQLLPNGEVGLLSVDDEGEIVVDIWRAGRPRAR